MAKREVEVNGQVYKIPEDFRLLRDDTPYPLSPTDYKVTAYTKDTVLKDAYVLNAMTLNTLFLRIQSDQDQLNTLPGLLASHNNTALTLFVTQSLSDLQWARIVHEATIHKTSLHLVLAPGVQLATHPEIRSSETLSKSPVQLIQTNDMDYTSEELSDDTLIIPVNEKTTYEDLTGTQLLTKNAHSISCHYQPGILTQSLQAGKKVALKGSFSPALAQQLEPLFLHYLTTNGQRIEHFQGQLTLITDEQPRFIFISPKKQTIDEKALWNKLHLIDSNNAPLLQAACKEFYKKSTIQPFQYVELMTMLKHLQHYPYSNPLKQLLRTRTDYRQLKPIAEAVWRQVQPTKKTKEELPVLEKRYHQLETRFKHSWYVFVVGSSGVGKSTTINQATRILGYEPVTTTGTLKDKLKAWLKPGAKRSLFIDEANLYETGELDILEGLYATPPKLLIDGIDYDVPPENRLIFAGNFGHSHGRQELRFIRRHGNVITFKEFNNTFLREHILQPFCKSLKINATEAEHIMALFIQAYNHVNKNNPTNTH